ncbi:hypothetical protein TVAG_295760 [Trichomonas vaginalis G3]|uniref:Uncharacterized protein n=1 Tax=Trichomonas vaginalis (strain ATCC PRA-98 / G3) TaxID=412133 RepID=A2F243_TRIV3|nr:hypothetical protein TVAGG3_0971700 [Trichomonas vaginalis G3]EAY01042.1 hypothetical protein TVAG_295760 [Trichomonas vaginalis G3]KAI5488637.1 hypothetical protein TVAGG3_0971700 [Trichomonas vaginalis G3]|eukprot:XP_001330080.1 hypothetical protein [Trichomonas vaginalis G3]
MDAATTIANLQARIATLEKENEALKAEVENFTKEKSQSEENHLQELLKISKNIIQPLNSNPAELEQLLKEKSVDCEKLLKEIARLYNDVENFHNSESFHAENARKNPLSRLSFIETQKKLYDEAYEYKKNTEAKLEEANILVSTLTRIFNCKPEQIISKSQRAAAADNENIQLRVKLMEMTHQQQKELIIAKNTQANSQISSADLINFQKLLQDKAKNFENRMMQILSVVSDNSEKLQDDIKSVYTKLVPTFTPTPSPKKVSPSPNKVTLSPNILKGPRVALSPLNYSQNKVPSITRPNASDFD